MRTLQEAIYNWLSIKVVYDARPNDMAAKETAQLFEQMLEENHNIETLHVDKKDNMYIVAYRQKGQEGVYQYPEELIEVMLKQMEREPDKFPNYFT